MSQHALHVQAAHQAKLHQVFRAAVGVGPVVDEHGALLGGEDDAQRRAQNAGDAPQPHLAQHGHRQDRSRVTRRDKRLSPAVFHQRQPDVHG
jgi:hypothetical protein